MKKLLVAGLFLLALSLVPGNVHAQSISLKLDIKALQALIETNMGGTYHLSGPFSMEDLTVTHIKNGKIHGTFDLLFDGTISIPIPFYGKKEVSLSKSFAMKFSFIPSISQGVLTIPVTSISVKGGGFSLSLGSRSLGIMVSFKRFLFSNKGQSLLDKTVKIDFQSLLKKHLGYKKWNVRLLLGPNVITVTGEPVATAKARGRG